MIFTHFIYVWRNVRVLTMRHNPLRSLLGVSSLFIGRSLAQRIPQNQILQRAFSAMPRALVAEQKCMPKDLVYREVQVPPPDSDQVQITVHACGVNFPDVLIIQGKYQFKPSYPFSPGGEVAGVVSAVGSDVTSFKVGDRVMGMCGWGGFAEAMNVDAVKVSHVPQGMDLETASAFSMTYGTSYHALKQRGKITPGCSVLVLGAAGGVGITAVELAKAMGASQIIAAASSPEKLEICRGYGATDVIDYSKDDLKQEVSRLTNGKGVDIIYDPVGGPLAEKAVRSLAWKGRYLVIGFASGEIPKIPLNLALLKGADIVGVFWGAFTTIEAAEHEQNNRDLFNLFSQGKIRPLITQRMPLSKAGAALEMMMRREVKGKVVVVPDSMFAKSKL